MEELCIKFKHKDIFEQYAKEIEKISATEYAEILDTTRQNISLKFNTSRKFLLEQTWIIRHFRTP